ncbi:MAG: 50S ribosomal protein L25 [Desulfomonilia bacterium]|jgi:large subunit ribosomal protein L25|uniref:50S ribosomal protein L25 n=1 Tax=anaerobic digester metagenome TaxID=1263854 RepID=A0A485M307_9ZZZZ|nr:50S ribosomal protein L25 [Pseudomonadota bacterium]HON38306.1 50S ribosomal protein L25 [Deltaproteobacteria bacterium]HRS55791.1 50S ribosomal protein L25 [Desulfomonilia bacterium]HPD21215.1 50S ribosomal protein L25 [Deltaproteobacteria bacterium]HPX18274.1 50S ribosomal protein L25 [Deltaproteobacteria bacterium]
MGTQDNITLALTPRSVHKKKVRALRREGIIPAVIYGRGFETTMVQVPRKDFEKAYKQTHGAAIIHAGIGGKKLPVLIHAVQRDSIKGDILHVDFLKVDMRHEVTVDVPLVFVGESPAEKEGAGKVGREATSISLKCLPTDIPSEIVVDVSAIVDKHDVIRAADLKLPEGVSLGHGVSEDKVIAVLVQAKFAEAPVEAAPEEAAAPAPEAPEA